MSGSYGARTWSVARTTDHPFVSMSPSRGGVSSIDESSLCAMIATASRLSRCRPKVRRILRTRRRAVGRVSTFTAKRSALRTPSSAIWACRALGLTRRRRQSGRGRGGHGVGDRATAQRSLWGDSAQRTTRPHPERTSQMDKTSATTSQSRFVSYYIAFYNETKCRRNRFPNALSTQSYRRHRAADTARLPLAGRSDAPTMP